MEYVLEVLRAVWSFIGVWWWAVLVAWVVIAVAAASITGPGIRWARTGTTNEEDL